MKTKQLLLAWVLACLLPLAAQADVWQDPETKVNYEYEPGSGVASVKAGSYTDSGSPNVSGNLVIPNAININDDEYLVKSIGAYAFNVYPSYYGGALTSVIIGNNVTTIEKNAFHQCSNLTSLVIGNSVATIGDGAFYGCSGLTVVSIPNSVNTIGNYAFEFCSGLVSLTIGNSVVTIGDRAFSDCSGLTSVSIPNSVITIGGGAFKLCKNLTSVSIGNNVKTIGADAFDRCGALTSVNIPSSITTIGKSAFNGCYNLVSVHISDIAAWCNISFGDVLSNPTHYNIYTSYGNDKIKHLYVGDEEIKDLIIPDSVESIGNYAFTGFNGLTSVTIPSKVTSIGEYAFRGCTASIHISDIAAWCNISFGKTPFGSSTEKGHRLYLGDEEIKDLVIPNSVMVIGDYAFSCCYLTSVNIPNSITSIGTGAFEYCRVLISLNIPNSIININSRAFCGCSSLASVSIPNSVISIGEEAFYGCGLTFLSIPNSVASIGGKAFGVCYGLREVVSYIKEPISIEKQTFYSDTYSQGTLYVPKNTADLYRYTPSWNLFQNIVEMEEETDNKAPTLLYTNPESGATDIPTSGKLLFVFDEPVKVVEDAKGKLNDIELIPVVNNDTIVCVDYSGLEHKQHYTFVLPTNSIMDFTGNYFAEDVMLTITTEPATISTAKQLYQQGEAVKLNGKAAGITNGELEIVVSGDCTTQTLTAKTDAHGAFAVEWTPYERQMGRYAIGVRYDGKDLADEPAQIDVIGLRRTSNGYITCEAVVGEPFTGEIEVLNPCGVTQHIKAVEVLARPDNCEVTTEQPMTIAGGSKATVKYTLTGSAPSAGQDWELVPLRLTTEEGATLDVMLYYYCRSAQAVLLANEGSINTTMAKGTTRDYPVTITNRGRGATGRIWLSMPDVPWLTLATPAEMASLAYGEQATVMLRLTPTDDMALNIPQTGTIGVNCENGDGIAIPFSIEVVSEQKGTLVIDVVDEYTEYSEGHPHVSGAMVEVKHPTTGALINQGTTTADGTCAIELPEGYYTVSVTADKHDSYTNYVLVDPGRETRQEVFLSYEAVTYTWTMEETEVQDKYEITTTVTLETNMPKPALIITLPDKKPGPGEVFPVVVKNEGLIKTENVSLSAYITGGFDLEILNNETLPELGAQQSHTFYAVIKGDAELWPSSCVTAWFVADGYYQCRGTQHVQTIAYLYYCTQSGGTVGGGGGGATPGPVPPFGGGGFVTVTGGAWGGGVPAIRLSDSVPAYVTLEIKQEMTLNRPAYRATLTVDNKHESVAVTGLGLNIVITDEDGKVATEQEFKREVESLSVFEGEAVLPGDWSLNAGKRGTATMLFVPTPEAAPDGPMDYTFKGTLTFTDPFTGQQLTLPLTPFTFTVQPMPELELTYLMQRDVYGDDPLTKNVEEPKEPAEFALIINNKGNGEVRNVKIVTEQPRITENEQGLLIDFAIVGAAVNGDSVNITPLPGGSFQTDFGNIAAHSQSYAQWWLTSTLLGHFISYDVEAVQQTDYGSLINNVTIHEMIRGFTDSTAPARRGWLVNDNSDDGDQPDVVYFSDATKEPLYIATGSITKELGLQYRLTVTPSQAGWNYYRSQPDAIEGRLKVARIVRESDGAELPADNAWTTDRTLPDGQEWQYENRLHFVVHVTGGSETYLLTFAADDGQDIEDIAIGSGPAVRIAGDRLYVTGDFNKMLGLSVYDLRGVKRMEADSKSVYVGHLKAGVYTVVVATDRGVWRGKIMRW